MDLTFFPDINPIHPIAQYIDNLPLTLSCFTVGHIFNHKYTQPNGRDGDVGADGSTG